MGYRDEIGPALPLLEGRRIAVTAAKDEHWHEAFGWGKCEAIIGESKRRRGAA